MCRSVYACVTNPSGHHNHSDNTLGGAMSKPKWGKETELKQSHSTVGVLPRDHTSRQWFSLGNKRYITAFPEVHG